MPSLCASVTGSLPSPHAAKGKTSASEARARAGRRRGIAGETLSKRRAGGRLAWATAERCPGSAALARLQDGLQPGECAAPMTQVSAAAAHRVAEAIKRRGGIALDLNRDVG